MFVAHSFLCVEYVSFTVSYASFPFFFRLILFLILLRLMFLDHRFLFLVSFLIHCLATSQAKAAQRWMSQNISSRTLQNINGRSTTTSQRFSQPLASEGKGSVFPIGLPLAKRSVRLKMRHSGSGGGGVGVGSGGRLGKRGKRKRFPVGLPVL